MSHITSENILLIGSTLLIAGVLIGKTSYRIGLPLLLIFLLVGMGFGTDGLGIQFSDMHTAQFIGMIALCIILFSGGMSTKVKEIRPVLLPGLVLSDSIADRIVRVVAVRNVVDQHPLCFSPLTAFGGHNVVDRFSLGVRHIRQPESRPPKPSAPYARA